MELTENIINFTISNHAANRYCERIMDKDNNGDINRFIASNEEKIKTDINKMLRYGELIYTGTQTQKDGRNGGLVDVYLSGLWVILVNAKTNNVITLYKIDLGLDDDFNKAYVSKMIEKLNIYKETLEETQQSVQEESNTYKKMISDAEYQIKEYKTMIKNLEELCSGYKTIIDNNIVKVSQANRDVADVINTLINKREF